VSSDAIEVLSVSFLLPAATCDLKLSSADKGWLNAIVFIGKTYTFLAHLAKGNVSFCHHLASVVH
jgi:hypothetical protein